MSRMAKFLIENKGEINSINNVREQTHHAYTHFIVDVLETSNTIGGCCGAWSY